MAVSETARLIASLELKDLFTKQVDNATKSLGKLDKGLDSSQSRAYKAGAQIGTGIKRSLAIVTAGVGFLATNVALGVNSLENLEKVTTQTNAVLKSTKGASGETAAGIRAMSNEFENLNATMDDTVIQSGANVLLTFTNITQKAFKPALQAALDLSTAMGQDLQSSVVQLGKALNDPVKGITALQRVGVSFTAQQKEQIKALAGAGDAAAKLSEKIATSRQKLAELTAEGKGNSKAADTLREKISFQTKAYNSLSAQAKDTSGVYKAQQIILAELNKEFGGSFIGQGQTTAGKFASVRDAVDDLQRSLATALLPALSKVADKVHTFLTSPEVVANISKLGDSIASLFSDENLAAGADFLKSTFGAAKAAAPILEASAKATLGFVQAAVSVFKQLPEPLQAVLVGGFALNKLTGGLVTNIAGGLADLLGKTRGASPANPVFVSDVTRGIGLPGVGGVGAGLPAAAGVAGIGSLVAAAAPFMLALVPSILIALDPNRKVGDQPLVTHGQSSPKGGQPTNPLYVSPVTANGLPSPILDRGGRETGVRAPIFLPGDTRSEGRATISAVSALAGKIADDRLTLKQLMKGISAEIVGALNTLRKSTDPKRVANAVKDLERVLVTNGRGGVEQTKVAIATLREKLKSIHDPTLEAAIRKTIGDLQAKLPNRIYAQQQVQRADRILASSKSTEDKIKGLQAIEKDLKDHKLPGQTRALQQKIDALKKSQADAAKATTQAVKDKDLSVKVTVPVNNRVNVNSRTVFAQQTIFGKTFNSQQAIKRGFSGGPQ